MYQLKSWKNMESDSIFFHYFQQLSLFQLFKNKCTLKSNEKIGAQFQIPNFKSKTILPLPNQLLGYSSSGILHIKGIVFGKAF
jgi:hypothetical protein